MWGGSVPSLVTPISGTVVAGAQEIIQPNPLPGQAPPEPAAQRQGQMSFEYLQAWRIHDLPEQPAKVFDHTDNRVSLCLRGFSCLSVCVH